MGGNGESTKTGPEIIDDEGLIVDCQFRSGGPVFKLDVWEVYLEFTNIQNNYQGDAERIFEAYGDWLRNRYGLPDLTYLGVAQIFKLVSDHVSADKKKSETTPESPTGTDSTPSDGQTAASEPGSTNLNDSTPNENSASETPTSVPTGFATSSKRQRATRRPRTEHGSKSANVS